MVIAKQMEIRANIKKYFDLAYNGNPVVVPRKENKNVVIISEEEYYRLGQARRVGAYAQAFLAGNETHSRREPFFPDVKTDNLNRLNSISELKDDWNGNGAPAFDDSVIEKVRALLVKLTIQPEIFPTALQTIQFEYDNSRRDHMEIEIGDSDLAEVFFVSYNGTESFETIPATVTGINKRVSAFFG